MFVRTLVAIGILLGTTTASSETIRLRTGEVMIGDIQSADFEKLVVHAVFPVDRKITLTEQQVAPETMYAALSKRLPEKDGSARLRLAEYCLASGMHAHAIVEARRAAKLDDAKATRASEIEKAAWESIAEGLLEEGKTYIAVEEPGLARLYLQSVIDRYPNAAAAKEAKRLLAKLPATDSGIAKAAVTDSKQKDKIRGQLTKARDYLEKADKRTSNLQRHFQPDKKDEHLLRRAEPYYRKAYSLLRKAAAEPTDDNVLDSEIRKLAATARSRLAKVHLELGTIYLARGAIKLAEKHCGMACQTEPENRDSHGLHQKIVDARIALRFGT